jgi:hypothetical protein
MPMAHTKVALEVQDDRGNVMVAVDSGARLVGTVRRVPEAVAVDDHLEIMLVFGDEPATMTVRASTAASWSKGRLFKASVVALDVGGIHLVPPASVPHHKPGLSGRLIDVPIAEIVQLLCAARRTATVQLVRDGQALGELAFVDGRAVCAFTTDGSAGADAFYALACLESGDFEVFYGQTLAEPNLHEDTLFLLLESARRADEAGRVVNAVAAVDGLSAAIDQALTAPSAPPPHETPSAEHKSDATSPGRRAPASPGLFSAFFEEFSAARRDKQRGSTMPRSDHLVDDDVSLPNFASLNLSSNEGQPGDQDPDVLVKASSAGPN